MPCRIDAISGTHLLGNRLCTKESFIPHLFHLRNPFTRGPFSRASVAGPRAGRRGTNGVDTVGVAASLYVFRRRLLGTPVKPVFPRHARAYFFPVWREFVASAAALLVSTHFVRGQAGTLATGFHTGSGQAGFSQKGHMIPYVLRYVVSSLAYVATICRSVPQFCPQFCPQFPMKVDEGELRHFCDDPICHKAADRGARARGEGSEIARVVPIGGISNTVGRGLENTAHVRRTLRHQATSNCMSQERRAKRASRISLKKQHQPYSRFLSAESLCKYWTAP